MSEGPSGLDAQEAAFLDQLQSAPDDEATRQVYADWLEERGDARAEYLRLGLRLGERSAAEQARARELGESAPADWLARVDRPVIEGCILSAGCPGRWEKLPSTDAPRSRRCDRCGRDVAYCPSVEEAQVQAVAGRYVAVASHLERSAGDVTFPAQGLALRVLRGQRPDVEYPIYDGLNFVGRADEHPVDIDLEEQEHPDRIYCSRQHACIRFEDGELAVEDLNSSNGTYLNRRRVYAGQQVALKVGDVIQIGAVQLRVVLL